MLLAFAQWRGGGQKLSALPYPGGIYIWSRIEFVLILSSSYAICINICYLGVQLRGIMFRSALGSRRDSHLINSCISVVASANVTKLTHFAFHLEGIWKTN